MSPRHIHAGKMRTVFFQVLLIRLADIYLVSTCRCWRTDEEVKPQAPGTSQSRQQSVVYELRGNTVTMTTRLKAAGKAQKGNA